MRSLFFLRSRRGPLLCFMFEGPRERDFPYSNRSVRCAPRRALCRARQRATFRGALLSGATDFSKAATPRARGPAGVLGCPTECRQETASPALRGGVALLEERATTARTPPRCPLATSAANRAGIVARRIRPRGRRRSSSAARPARRAPAFPPARAQVRASSLSLFPYSPLPGLVARCPAFSRGGLSGLLLRRPRGRALSQPPAPLRAPRPPRRRPQRRRAAVRTLRPLKLPGLTPGLISGLIAALMRGLISSHDPQFAISPAISPALSPATSPASFPATFPDHLADHFSRTLVRRTSPDISPDISPAD